jgi:predicted  nucleic acid-binding Zn-ribbon protein
MKKNETEIWKLRAEAHYENYLEMLKRVEKLVAENELWKKEAELWRNMYVEYDEMLDADIASAQNRISKINSEIEKMKKEMNKGY